MLHIFLPFSLIKLFLCQNSKNSPNPTLLIVNAAAAGLSFFAEIFVINLYCKFQSSFRRGQAQIAFCLNLLNMLESLSDFGFFLNPAPNGFVCVMNGFIRLFALICSVMWVCAISRYAVALTESLAKGENLKPKLWTYVSISIIIPFICCSIPLYGSWSGQFPGYEYDLIGCLGDPGTLLLVLYIPVTLGFVYIIYNFKKVARI